MLRELAKIANYLDERGLRKEADSLDRIIRKMATFNSSETKTGVEVEIDAEEAPNWGEDAANKLLEALKEEVSSLDLIKSMEHSFDEEALDRYGEESYLTTWTYKLLDSFNKGFEYKWELGREVDYEKQESVDFALSPVNWWEGEKIIHVRYTPGNLKIRAWEN